MEGAPATSLIALIATPVELSVCDLSTGKAVAAAARHTRAKRAFMLVDDAIRWSIPEGQLGSMGGLTGVSRGEVP